MNQGSYQITVLDVNLQNAKQLVEDENAVELKIGPQKTTVTGKGKIFKTKEIRVFNTGGNNVLEIYVHQNGKDIGSTVVYGEIRLEPLLKYPRDKNVVTVHMAYKEKEELKNQHAGTIQLEVIYYESSEYDLKIFVQSAILLRDTDVMTDMDPYLIINIDQHTQRTTVKQQAGKKPVWNQLISFSLNNIPSTIQFKVMDQDVTTDDIVGSKSLSPHDSGIFISSPQQIKREIEVYFEGKPAGKISLRTQFIRRDTKP